MWFKNKSFDERSWRVILRNPGMDVTIFNRGMSVSALQEKWASLLLIIQKFITCEGRFRSMYMYQTHLLMNFLENQTLNLPYFLLNSLKKVSTTVQKNLGDVESHLYHHGLVKILIEKQLKEKKDTWEQFLVRNFFKDPQETPESSTSRRSKIKKTSDRIQDIPTNTIKETSREEKLPEDRKERTEGKKPRKSKGKRSIEAIHQTPEPSSEEDHQILSKRLVYLQEQSAAAKKKGKEKQSFSPQNLRRSSRLKGKLRKIQIKWPQFIDLGGETPEQPSTISPSRGPHHTPISRPDFDMSPSRPDFEISPSQQDFGVSPRNTTPEIDPNQQEMYDYIESLEKMATDPGTSSTQHNTTQESQIQSLKQEVFELEVLNRHIKRENRTLKEQGRLDKIIHENTMLHLGLWQKKNRKLNKKNRRLSRALINLKFRCLMRKPRMVVVPRKKKRRLDVLAEVSEHMN